MAIPTPTIPSAVSPVSAVRLNPTQNNKAFYVNSGLIGVNNSETTVISINDIGKRDMLFCINPIFTTNDSDNVSLKLKNNGTIIYQAFYDIQNSLHTTLPLHFIIPANTSIEITMENADSSTHQMGISAYGYYLETFR